MLGPALTPEGNLPLPPIPTATALDKERPWPLRQSSTSGAQPTPRVLQPHADSDRSQAGAVSSHISLKFHPG